MARLKLILILIVLTLLGVIAFQNREPVELKFLTETLSLPTTLVIFFTAILGFSVGILFGARIPRNLKVTVPEEKPAPKKAKASEKAEPEA